MINAQAQYLIRDHHQRVFILREKIKKTPEPKSIFLREHSGGAPVWSVVFLRCEGPTQLINVFFFECTLFHLEAHIHILSC